MNLGELSPCPCEYCGRGDCACERVAADAAAKERERIVAFLRADICTNPECYICLNTKQLADAIERGEHDTERKP